MQVSLYDRVSSMLLALLMTIGLVAVVLFILWLSNKIFVPQVAVPAEIIEVSEDGEGGGDGRPAGGSQLDTPSDEPFVGKDKETTDIQEDLQRARRRRRLEGGRVGRSRAGGAHAARQLRHRRRNLRRLRRRPRTRPRPRKARLAQALGGHVLQEPPWTPTPGNSISSRSNWASSSPTTKSSTPSILPKPKPDTRIVSNPAVNEKRYYLTWRNGEMQQADQDLLARAGVDLGDRLILKFLPKEIELQLMGLEKAVNNLTPKDIRKTRFGVQPDGDGFKFYVLEQSIKR